MNILGVSFLSDASAVVVKDGELVSAISEERINRIKLWNGIPHQSIKKALELAGLTIEDIDIIATHGAAPAEVDPVPFKEKEKIILDSDLSQKRKKEQINALRKRLKHESKVLGERTPDYLNEIKTLGRPVKIFKHHEAHAASAYYACGWSDCLILTADGWGEDGSATLYEIKDGKLNRLSKSETIDSLGYFYGSITKSLGFVPHRHEGKVLGLAAYCKNPSSYKDIRAMIDYDKKLKRFVSNMENGMYIPNFENPYLDEYVRGFSREDIASSAQRTLEEVVCAFVSDIAGSDLRIALAGGIFANVKLNQRIRELPNVKEVYVFPNMGDGGLSAGSAWLAYHLVAGVLPKPLKSMFLGPEFSDEEISSVLKSFGYKYSRKNNIEECAAHLLSQNKIVARFDGRMEFGPRALGNRSILYHATDPKVNTWLNEHLNRSEFMPFAPVTLGEYAQSCYKDLDSGKEPSKYMTMTFDCTEKMKKEAPATVHVDGTARPQIITADNYPKFYKILSMYHELTGRTSIINTSFNMHEEPIVCTPEDALRAFSASNLPYLAIGNYLVENEEKL